jgi:hypothetical protein
MTYGEHVLGEALGLPVTAPGELLGTHSVLAGLDGGLPRLPVLHPQAAQRTQVQLLLHLQDLIPAHQRRGSGPMLWIRIRKDPHHFGNGSASP